jgi:hypothetical protein
MKITFTDHFTSLDVVDSRQNIIYINVPKFKVCAQVPYVSRILTYQQLLHYVDSLNHQT